MEKFDIKKACKTLYGAPVGEFAVVDVPPLKYLMIDGAGDPNTASEYKAAVEALYAASYTLKFMSKAALHRDYVVPPLEGLWWSEDMADFVARRKDRWRWTMMIAVPDFIEGAMADEAIAKAREKKQLPALPRLRFEQLAEGQAVQTLHIGAYDDEGPILKCLHQKFAGAPARAVRTSPRDLPERSAQDRGRKAQDHPAPAGSVGVTGSVMKWWWQLGSTAILDRQQQLP